MKGKLNKYLVKLLSLALAFILVFPTEIFAMTLDDSKANAYKPSESVMGLASNLGSATDQKKEKDDDKRNLIKSDLSQEETDTYIIEKSAVLSKITGQIDYKIVLKAKNPNESTQGNQIASFAITENTDLKDLKLEKVEAQDTEGTEKDIKYTQSAPNVFSSNDAMSTLGISSAKVENAIAYYLSAKLTDDALADIENTMPNIALEISIADEKTSIYQGRYALDLVKNTENDIVINQNGDIENQENKLEEIENPHHLYSGSYVPKKDEIFSKTPAKILWTDYIRDTDDKEFSYDIKLDKNQDTRDTQIKIDFYEASEKAYVLKQGFTKTMPFANTFNIQIPQGYIAKVGFTTKPKENTNAKIYSFNGKEIPNPSYKKEKTDEDNKSETEDSDPDPAKEKAEATTSEQSQDQDKEKSESQASAIDLNKDSLLSKFKNEDKLNPELVKEVDTITNLLDSYNKEEISWEDFVEKSKTTKLSKEDYTTTITTLIAGLEEGKYKVANIDTNELINAIYPADETKEQRSEPSQSSNTKKSVDDLVKEKLADPSTTLEDFQNYMYELEEEYGLTNEDADRIYTDNAEAIEALIKNQRDNNLDPMVLAEIINTNRHTIDEEWTEDEGLREALNKYQLAIYGYGNPVVEDDNITSIDWDVTYYSDKPLSTQGLLASITAVKGSGIDTDAITDIKVNGSPITLTNNPADGKHGINNSYNSDLSDQDELTEYKIEFSTPVTEKQDYYTIDFSGQYNNVDDSSLKDRKPRGSARLTSPGYISAQKTKDNPDASYADNKQTVRGYYTDLVDGKPTKARWIVTDHVTTQNEQSLPFKTRELTNQELESLKVSFYTPDESGKLVKLGETEDLTDDYPLSQGSLFAHPPIGTIAVYEYVTNLKGDPYETEYALGDTKLGKLTEEYTIKKEWQGITNETEIPAIDVTLTGSDSITNVKTRLSGVLDQDRRETTKVNLPKWTISQNAEQGLDYNKIEYKVSEEKIGDGVNYTNLASNVIEHLKEIELVNKVVKGPTPGSLTVELLETDSDSPLDNVEFTISCPEIEKTARTGSDGKILFDKLPEGTYTIVQNDVKTGYRKPVEKGHIRVDSDGNITWMEDELIAKGTSESKNPTLNIYNDKLDNVEFKIKKISENNIALDGARFELRDKNGNLVSSGTSGADGYINFENVTAGQYTLKETQAPNGYDLSDKVYEVTIDESNYIEIKEDGKVIAKGYPENMNDGSSSTETKVVVNKNELILDETGQAGGRANVLDRYRFETLNYVLEMNVENPKASDQFSIKFDDKLNIERNIGHPFPDIYDKDKNLVATFVNFNKDTNELIYKFNPDYIKPGMDINIKYEVNGIRPDDYKVLNKYGEGQISGHPGAKNWTFSTDLNYNASSKDSRDFSVEIDMASGSDSLVYSSNNAIGSSVLDINRNEETRDPETFKEVFYINPVPGKDIGTFNSILLKFMTQSKSKGANMSYNDIISGQLPNKGFSYTGYRVYRVPDSKKYDLMPTSYGVDENALKNYEYTSYKPSGMRQDSFETIVLSNMKTTRPTDAFVIVVDFKVTNPDIVDKNFLANQVQKKGGSNESRGFFMGIGGASAKSNAVITSIPIPAPFSLEIPNEKYLPGSFELLKKDSENNNSLSDAVFTLYDENQSQVIDQKITSADGKIVFENLSPGSYKLVESKQPSGYMKLQNASWDVKVTKDGKTTVYEDAQAKALYTSNNDNLASIITNNNKSNAINGYGNASTDIEDIGNNRYKITTTLNGDNAFQDAIVNTNTSNSGNPEAKTSGYEHFLSMHNYGKSYFDSETSEAKAEFYVLLNSNPKDAYIDQNTKLDLKANNFEMTNLELHDLGNNNTDTGKNHISSFRNGNVETVWGAKGNNAFTQENNKINITRNGDREKRVSFPKERFGSHSDGQQGRWMFIAKVTGTIKDSTQPVSLDVNWNYNNDVSKETVTLKELGIASKPDGYRNTLQGELIHNISDEFTIVDDSTNSFYIDQGKGTTSRTTIVQSNGGQTGTLSPLSSISFNHVDGTSYTIGSQDLPKIDISQFANPNQALQVENTPNSINFEKFGVGNDETKLEGVKFQLQRNGASYGEVKTSSKTDSVVYNKLPDGRYTLKEVVPAGSIDNNKSNDDFIVYKLGDNYYQVPKNQIVAEFEVVDGKILNLSSWRKDSDSDSLSMIVSETTENVRIDNKITDTPTPTYPSTGGAGSFIGFALIGTAVMLAGIAYYAIYQKDRRPRR